MLCALLVAYATCLTPQSCQRRSTLSAVLSWNTKPIDGSVESHDYCVSLLADYMCLITSEIV